MAPQSITLVPASESTITYVEAVLDANDLPSRDVRSKPSAYYVGYDDGDRDDDDGGDGGDGEDPIGIGGIERYGRVGLLRSLVVERAARGKGFGTALCEALETQARADGVEALYLLTTTAAGFFLTRGYDQIERESAPESIRATTEFDDLCPASATCMKKEL